MRGYQLMQLADARHAVADPASTQDRHMPRSTVAFW